MNFNDALKLVGLAEGGYSNHPLDSGGETICGIARNKNPNCAIWKTIDKWKERGNTTPESLTALAKNNPEFMGIVNAFYRGAYWGSCRCDELPNLWRYPVFSCAVNCGPRQAIKFLQMVVGAKVDGIYGGETTQMARIYEHKDEFVDKYCTLWARFYEKIVEKKPSQKAFLNGWKNRIADVKKDNF